MGFCCGGSRSKSKPSTVERVKVGVGFEVEAVEVGRVDVLAAGVERTPCRKVGEAPLAEGHLGDPGGKRRGGGAGVQVAQGGGGRGPAHQQAHRPHRPGVAAVAMAKTV